MTDGSITKQFEGPQTPPDMSDWEWTWQKFQQPTEECLTEAIEHYMGFLQRLGIWDAMGEEPKRRTPARVAAAYLELFGRKLEPINFTVFPAPDYKTKCDDLIVVRGIQFSSLCSHHHMPFDGLCNVGYVPDRWIVGISKIPRVVEHATHGASIQEDVTADIANFLEAALQAKGVIVMMTAEHSCMTCRGVRKPGASVVTLTTRGCFNESQALIDRFIGLSAQ